MRVQNLTKMPIIGIIGTNAVLLVKRSVRCKVRRVYFSLIAAKNERFRIVKLSLKPLNYSSFDGKVFGWLSFIRNSIKNKKLN